MKQGGMVSVTGLSPGKVTRARYARQPDPTTHPTLAIA
jgi:hypothetical protein